MRKIYCWRGHIFTTLSTNQSARLFCLLLGLKATAPQIVVGGGGGSKSTRLLCQYHRCTCLPALLVFVGSSQVILSSQFYFLFT